MQIKMNSAIARRQFLQVGSACATLPLFVRETGALFADSSQHGLGERILVVVQLAGGNDGLNTIVPYKDDEYDKLRGELALPGSDVRSLSDELGIHSAMTELCEHYEAGRVSIVNNVGYPNPNRSHFRSTEIWETGSAESDIRTGWAGRYFDSECSRNSSPMLGLQFGDKPAMTFAHPQGRAVTLNNPSLFTWETSQAGPYLDLLNEPQSTENSELDFLQRTANTTLGLSRKIQISLSEQKTSVKYLPFNFSQSMKIVAQMIAADIPTKIYYVSLGGFDTHTNQLNRHAGLLQELSQGLSSFLTDLEQTGHLERTLVMTFSEFGRRVAPNDQKGTDHGTAGPMFIAGGNLKTGLHGGLPDLHDLDEGDLKYKVDFRSVYASILMRWLGADASKILAGDYPILPLFA